MMRKRYALVLATVGFVLATSTSVTAQTAPSRAAADELTVADRQLRADGWEFVGDVTRTPAKPREGEAMVVLADNRGYRRAGLPMDLAAAPPGHRPEGAGRPAQGSSAEDLMAAPTEPVGVLLGPNDDRDLVTSDLDKYPLRTIGTLSGNPNGGTGCTGTLVGPRHVITAAHCLYDENGIWFETIYFNPGQAGSTDTNGTPRKMVARYARTWSLSMDYGLVILADEARTAKLGWMGMGWRSPLDSYTGIGVQNHGYPLSGQQCAASPLPDGTCGGFMYTDTCNVQVPTEGYLMDDCDTTGGHSGSAVWRWVDGSPRVMAIHKRGNEPGSGAVQTSSLATLNIGARMRPAMFNDICGWMGNFKSQFASHSLCAP